MVTYEDVTGMFLDAAEATGLSVHPEFWLHTQTLEREFACTLHPGPCEEAEAHANCTVSFAWGPLDTVLSIDGAEGICEFFHEPDENCPHLHTDDVPPLALDLTFSLQMTDKPYNPSEFQSLTRSLKLRASEYSSRATETRPSIALTLGDDGMQVEGLTIQQRVELPLWDPEGISGFRSNTDHRAGHMTLGRGRRHDEENEELHPEDWLPPLFTEVLADITRVIAALESVNEQSQGHTLPESNQEN